jgi:hypothetical protein
MKRSLDASAENAFSESAFRYRLEKRPVSDTALDLSKQLLPHRAGERIPPVGSASDTGFVQTKNLAAVD